MEDGGETIKVVEDNDHLVQVISELKQENKNIDTRIKKARCYLQLSNSQAWIVLSLFHKIILLSPFYICARLHIFSSGTDL